MWKTEKTGISAFSLSKRNSPERIPFFHILFYRHFFFHVCPESEFKGTIPMHVWKRNKRVVGSLLEVIDPVNYFSPIVFPLTYCCSGFRFAVKPVNGTEYLLSKAAFFKCLAYDVNVCNKVIEIRVFENSPQEIELIFFQSEFGFRLFWAILQQFLNFFSGRFIGLSAYRLKTNPCIPWRFQAQTAFQSDAGCGDCKELLAFCFGKPATPEDCIHKISETHLTYLLGYLF